MHITIISTTPAINCPNTIEQVGSPDCVSLPEVNNEVDCLFQAYVLITITIWNRQIPCAIAEGYLCDESTVPDVADRCKRDNARSVPASC